MTNQQENWYIVKNQDNHCQIILGEKEKVPEAETIWGPFPTQTEAIARRVGLIRAGKCQPF
ncbi:MAG: hypothetical protein DSM107014_03220 [Gomphosphaeria aponina SAG 52.96 = DSM 107014]|uniref:DDE transposase family protein n=1 Tax=Gomphosphaeria aponina SAG 52.96 = DSM 107014 TaxID=1521640 RepID=A0A941GNB9_9CHRO|nr:hypothetical protein [Gomphosphaeria aponina SAG 52.96 = DSM 107014]